MSRWTQALGLTPESLVTAARTTLGTVIAVLAARLLRLPEFYWAPISTIVILLSTIDPLTLAWQRFAGTAVGALLGAFIASIPHHDALSFNWAIYGAGIFVCGMVSSALRLRSAYRFAAITLTIVLLIPHRSAPWIIATHRFIEVSLGIAIALLITLTWRVPAPAVPAKRTL